MTRREEIRHKAGSIVDGMIQHNVPKNECKGYYEGYIEGAEYADKTMIKKICNFIIAFNERAKLGIIEPLINVEIFCKAMEE